jgi:hypothetical protein
MCRNQVLRQAPLREGNIMPGVIARFKALRQLRGLLNRLMNEMRRVSAASVDSQFPVDPRYAGPRAG